MIKQALSLKKWKSITMPLAESRIFHSSRDRVPRKSGHPFLRRAHRRDLRILTFLVN